MATLAESFMADLADLSDDSASDNEAPQEQQLDGNDLLVGARFLWMVFMTHRPCVLPLALSCELGK